MTLPVTAEVTKRFADTNGKLAAFCKFTIADSFVVHNVQVLRRNDGSLRVAMPPQRKPDGSVVQDAEGYWREVCHPVNAETRAAIVEAVLSAVEADNDQPV